jgi:hypothetical protein
MSAGGLPLASFRAVLQWPRASPLVPGRGVLVKGQFGARLELTVDFLRHRRHLPRITITSKKAQERVGNSFLSKGTNWHVISHS